MKMLLYSILFVSATLTAASPLLTVGDPDNPGKLVKFGNLPNSYPRGGVPYVYRIAEREVTNAEYAEFLNARATSAEDSAFCWRKEMAIRRSGEPGAYRYAPEPGRENAPANWMTRYAAARYCNHLSGAEVYRLEMREIDGKRAPNLIGGRDLTRPDSPRLYYLPDMDEFYKAGFYDGRGDYPAVTAETRGGPSRYGLRNVALGVSEWMENRAVESSYALGAADASTAPDDWNALKFHLARRGDFHAAADVGFRVAATAPVAVAPELNADRNIFGPGSREGVLRLRCDDAEAGKPLTLQISLTGIDGQELWKREERLTPKAGINAIPLPLPEYDGWFALWVTPPDGSRYRIPLLVAREAIPAPGPEKAYGLNAHIKRWELGFSFEPFDFDRVRRIGASTIRANVNFDNPYMLEILKRIREAGLTPFAVLPNSHDYREWGKNLSLTTPELTEKWQKHGVAREFALVAEKTYELVLAGKTFCRDWELGNEPHFWKIAPEDYASYAKACAKAVRLADPAARIHLGDMGSIAAPVLAMRAGEVVDAISMHTYCNFSPAFWGSIGFLRNLNGMKAAAGIPDKPVWVTEVNLCTYNSTHVIPYADLEEVLRYQALNLPKAMAGTRAYGAEKVFVYNYRDVPVGSREAEFGLFDAEERPKPAAAAYRLTARLTGDAEFTGFLPGHSDRPGEVAALAFRDRSGSDVAVLWRNDAALKENYTGSMAKILHPAQSYPLAMAEGAEQFRLDGPPQKLESRNGKVMAAVNEFPSFVRGRLSPERAEVATARPQPSCHFPEAVVAFPPEADNTVAALDLMAGYSLTAIPGERRAFTVRVHNLGDRTLCGKLWLIPAPCWWDWPWSFEPAETVLDVPPQGMATAVFTTRIPPSFTLNREFALRALYLYGEGRAAEGKITVRSVPAVSK